MKETTVVIIRSVSYTGTTWINLILGSHERAIALGPPLRAYELSVEQADDACLLHGADCELWPEFVRNRDRNESFFHQLSEASGKDVIVLNNPLSLDPKEFDYPGIKVKYFHVVRDGRANVVSLMQHAGDRFESIYDATREWILRFNQGLSQQMSQLDDVFFVRYEDVIVDPGEFLENAGAFIGIDYPENATRYWEFEQHPVSGNGGAIDMLRRLKGMEGVSHSRWDTYELMLRLYEEEPDCRVIDETWRDKLSLEERFAYDFIYGDMHEKYGYKRDRFTISETRHCLVSWGLRLGQDIPERPARIPTVRTKFIDRHDDWPLAKGVVSLRLDPGSADTSFSLPGLTVSAGDDSHTIIPLRPESVRVKPQPGIEVLTKVSGKSGQNKYSSGSSGHVRKLPFPFNHFFTINNDCDGSTINSWGHVGNIVRGEYALPISDSLFVDEFFLPYSGEYEGGGALGPTDIPAAGFSIRS